MTRREPQPATPVAGIRSLGRRVASSFAGGPLAAPFITFYLLASWVIFLLHAEPGAWVYETPADELSAWLYNIPDLVDDTGAAVAAIVTAPWVHRTAVQLVFVTIGLLVFGTRLEYREGPIRTAGIFFATTAAAAITAGVVLHIIYPGMLDFGFLETAWNRTWGGGSAGLFGVIGALIGRARRPLPLLGLVLLWEAAFTVFVYQDYVPAFHLPALLAGFVATRYVLPGSRDETAMSLLTGARPQ